MYRIKEEVIDIFKEYRTNSYAKYIGCNPNFVSTIINGGKACSTMLAEALIGFRFDVTIRYIVENNLLEKYFTKEN